MSKLNYTKQRILKQLGDAWTTRFVDGELCIYRDLGDHDLVISGGSGHTPVCLHVWAKAPRYHVVERHNDLNPRMTDFGMLCEGIAEKYAERHAHHRFQSEKEEHYEA